VRRDSVHSGDGRPRGWGGRYLIFYSKLKGAYLPTPMRTGIEHTVIRNLLQINIDTLEERDHITFDTTCFTVSSVSSNVNKSSVTRPLVSSMMYYAYDCVT